MSTTDKKQGSKARHVKPAVDLAELRAAVSKEKCGEPAALMARHGHQGEFVPLCEDHAEAAVERSAEAGKKPLPKGADKDSAAAYEGSNQDDHLPLHRRALTPVEREMNLKCLNHLLGEQINA